MQNDEGADDSRTLATNRTMEIVVALVLLAGAAIVIYDSVRIGFGWREGEGPAPGYYPFWVAVLLALASMVNLIKAAVGGHGAGEIFVTLRPFLRILAVLFPTFVFIGLIGGISVGPLNLPGIGMYFAATVFILFFMLAVGRESILKAVFVSIFVPLLLFFMFEKWFLVPLPKCDLAACDAIAQFGRAATFGYVNF
jgi:putative tricarboxylic transport membrane protein